MHANNTREKIAQFLCCRSMESNVVIPFIGCIRLNVEENSISMDTEQKAFHSSAWSDAIESEKQIGTF